MSERRFDAVLFDWGGTLVTLETSFPAMLGRALSDAGSPIKRETLVASLLATDQWMHDLNAQGTWVDELTQYQQLLACAGVKSDLPKLAKQVLDAVRREQHWVLDPEVPELLQRLCRHGCQMAVVSNWDRMLEDQVCAMGISEYFIEIIASGKVSVAKPERAIFELGLKATQTPPDRALHVGDHPQYDVRGAQAVGLSAVLLDRGECNFYTVPFAGSDGLPRINRLTEVLSLVLYS